MATPHVVGIAALIKQLNPSWTPSSISSALSTTATKYDNYGELILSEGYDIDSFYPSTHFDVGAGLVNPTRAIDPGLVFISGDHSFHLRRNHLINLLTSCILKQNLTTT